MGGEIKNALGVSFVNKRLPIRLSLWQQVCLRLFGRLFIGYREICCSEMVQEYLIKCPKHGLLVTTPNGYSKKLYCINCLKESLNDLDLI